MKETGRLPRDENRTASTDARGLDAAELLERAAWSRALSLVGAVRCEPFGPGYDVCKVSGKVFMLTTDLPGRFVVTLKCEREHALALKEEFPTITPGHHMNKRHWCRLLPDRKSPTNSCGNW
jgi:predicted DNA-binding protein (MmcQ/YjbR family)